MPIDQSQLVHEIMDLLEETFEQHHGIYLDENTSLLQTLATIDHRQASLPVGGKCATLAAQVTHVIFYLDVLEDYFAGNDPGKVDWGEIWRTVADVTAEEWDALRVKLERTYRRISATLRETPAWEAEPQLAAALAMTIHTAYHLGEIRQALCILA